MLHEQSPRFAEAEARGYVLSTGYERGAGGVANYRQGQRHLDFSSGSASRATRALGAPQAPSPAALLAIEERQGLGRAEPDRVGPVRGGALALEIALPLPAVSLIEVRPTGPRRATA